MRLARSFPDHTISREALESRYEKAIKGDDFGQRYYIIEEGVAGSRSDGRRSTFTDGPVELRARTSVWPSGKRTGGRRDTARRSSDWCCGRRSNSSTFTASRGGPLRKTRPVSPWRQRWG